MSSSPTLDVEFTLKKKKSLFKKEKEKYNIRNKEFIRWS